MTKKPPPPEPEEQAEAPVPEGQVMIHMVSDQYGITPVPNWAEGWWAVVLMHPDEDNKYNGTIVGYLDSQDHAHSWAYQLAMTEVLAAMAADPKGASAVLDDAGEPEVPMVSFEDTMAQAAAFGKPADADVEAAVKGDDIEPE